MRTATFHFVEEILRDYPETEKNIRYIQQEVLGPFNLEPDVGIGGRRKQNRSSRGVEYQAMTIATSKAIHNLRINQYVVEVTLAESDDLTQEIITELYFKRNSTLTITGVAMKLHIGRTVASRKRTSFFEKVVHQLGIRP
ncbi:transcriptional regulator [Levilactobacillus huananensis]|uniref:transcriptional regulator n=1 Tax=Levilactobacillus huananensis TaxID=2486019 RepID=UPI0013DE071A|nr:transcriptional regulator [Levilactobacillus huananensis]